MTFALAAARAPAQGQQPPATPALRQSLPPIGNQARLRRLTPTAPRVQARLMVGAVDDPLEREAEQVVAQVMGMAEPPPTLAAGPARVSRKCAACAEEETLRPKRAEATAPTSAQAPAPVYQALRESGQALDAGTRGFFEPRLGADLSGVRVHHGEPAAAAARAVGAHAFAVGHDIVFADGAFAPASTAGRRLLAHELAHVLQQTGPATLRRAPDPPAQAAETGNAAPSPAAPAPDMAEAPAPSQPAAPAAAPTVVPCAALPTPLGTRGRCGDPIDDDFKAGDHPALGLGHTLLVAPFRLEPDILLLGHMAGELDILAGNDGIKAAAHFADGTGTKKTFTAGSNLADLAAKSASFATAVSAVQTALTAALRAQKAAGTIDCSKLSLSAAVLPQIGFGFADAFALKAVIGGTHGLTVNLLSFTFDPATGSYTATLQFVICDNFGVDETDLYSPGLISFWVLQHERSGYAPFVNEIVLNTTVTGTV